VELPEFTGVRDGGYRSLGGRLRWGAHCRAGNDPLRRRKENQDAFCVRDALADDRGACLFSVFDGHGPQGAFVSHFVREQFHHALADAYAELLPRASSGSRRSSVSCDVVAEMFQRAAHTLVERLDNSAIDVSVSGTTAVTMLVRETDVFIANVGDSRAVVARFSEDEQRYVLHCETKDHKPDVPEECARIERSNGRVFEWGSFRVWLQDVDMPGLAMSRSFGDSVAKTVGVTAEPDVTIVEKLPFSSGDGKNGQGRPAAFAVLASDGIWEFMTTDECIDFVAGCILDSGMSPQEACTALVEEACDRWDAEEDVVDDITAAVVFF
jgi:serine/threonine protein phosphatase PrpC